MSLALIFSTWSGIGGAYTDSVEFSHAFAFYLAGEFPISQSTLGTSGAFMNQKLIATSYLSPPFFQPGEFSGKSITSVQRLLFIMVLSSARSFPVLSSSSRRFGLRSPYSERSSLPHWHSGYLPLRSSSLRTRPPQLASRKPVDTWESLLPVCSSTLSDPLDKEMLLIPRLLSPSFFRNSRSVVRCSSRFVTSSHSLLSTLR